MGFETQEEAEKWAESMEFRADQLREERMLETPREAAWREITALPAYNGMPDSVKSLQKGVFEFAWMRAIQSVQRR